MRLKEWLRLHNIKQKALAAKAGLSAGYVSKVARGEIYPTAEMAERIRAATFGRVTPNDLFDEWKERAGTASSESDGTKATTG